MPLSAWSLTAQPFTLYFLSFSLVSCFSHLCRRKHERRLYFSSSSPSLLPHPSPSFLVQSPLPFLPSHLSPPIAPFAVATILSLPTISLQHDHARLRTTVTLS
ncbi:hypothetical protein IE53DRAFT_134677 [Violaceomyces palustris]|uniref:Uncharacterized protein n=1 Tax=Violaceomyces palustris TaxID=1673888 RepID=A0ACD0NUX9_9BASI|nr:hypothetical protein IE53DRAFT_134677 [Violaceomyces palustris]